MWQQITLSLLTDVAPWVAPWILVGVSILRGWLIPGPTVRDHIVAPLQQSAAAGWRSSEHWQRAYERLADSLVQAGAGLFPVVSAPRPPSTPTPPTLPSSAPTPPLLP